MIPVAGQDTVIPLLDLPAQHEPLHDEILAAWSRLLRAGSFTGGAEVEAFEHEFAAACEVEHCVALSSGTDALVLALRALGIGPGDRVIVPANTFFASAEAVSLVGAEVALVDCDPRTRTISVDAVARELRARGAAAVIAVHLYGHPADVDALTAVAARFGAPVVEDACQAHLARAHGFRVGGLGRIACFSFYPSKNLGATGEAGAVTTHEPALADAIRELRHHGQRAPNRHERVGYNARLGELTAAALRIKLRHLEAWTRRAPPGRRALPRRADRRRRRPAARHRAVGGAGLAPVRGRGGGPRRRARGPGRDGHPYRPALPDADPPPAGVRVPRAGRRLVPGGGAQRRPRALAPDVPRAHRRTGRSRRRSPLGSHGKEMVMQRALITGGLGLVGSHIADALVEQGVTVVVLDDLSRGRHANLAWARANGDVRVVEGDIRDRALVRRLAEGIDVVFHQAALRITRCADEPRLAVDVLVGGTQSVLEAAVQAGVRKVVAASSASVYGMAERFPTPESHHPYNNDTLYGAAKAFNEGMLRSYHAMHGLDYVALRYFNVYGPRMDVHGVYTEVLVRWMERIAAGRAPLILGDGRQTMDFVHVADIARANLLAASSDVTDEVFNIASGTETSLADLARTLLDVMGADPFVEHGPPRAVNNVARRLASTARAEERLGFRSEVTLDEGLRSLVEWWQAERAEAAVAWT